MSIGRINIVSDRLEKVGNFDIFVLENQWYVYLKGKVYGPYTELIALTDNILNACNYREPDIRMDIMTIWGSYYSVHGTMDDALKYVSMALQESMSNSLLEKCKRGIISKNYLYTITAVTSDNKHYIIDVWLSILSEDDKYSGVWDIELGAWKTDMERRGNKEWTSEQK